ncbi:MAG: AAA family ATPase [Candidatus Thorarchaeota archaeon]
MVLGPSGSGKSTFAKALADRLGLPWINLDHHYWRPNWEEMPEEEWREAVANLIAREEWVMDGNYSKTLEIRIKRADTAIFLDVPRRVSFWRVLKRRVIHHGKVRPELAEGCTEKIDLDFLRWIWGYPNRTRPVVDRILNDNSKNKTIVVLKGAKQAEEYLANVSD